MWVRWRLWVCGRDRLERGGSHEALFGRGARTGLLVCPQYVSTCVQRSQHEFPFGFSIHSCRSPLPTCGGVGFLKFRRDRFLGIGRMRDRTVLRDSDHDCMHRVRRRFRTTSRHRHHERISNPPPHSTARRRRLLPTISIVILTSPVFSPMARSFLPLPLLSISVTAVIVADADAASPRRRRRQRPPSLLSSRTYVQRYQLQ